MPVTSALPGPRSALTVTMILTGALFSLTGCGTTSADWAKETKPAIDKLDSAAADVVAVGPTENVCLRLLHAVQDLEEGEGPPGEPATVVKRWKQGLDHLGTAAAACGQGEADVMGSELASGVAEVAGALSAAEKAG